MADSKWSLRPHGDWETNSLVPWGGVCFSDNLSFEYSESNSGSEIYKENILEVKYPRMYTTANAPAIQMPQVLGSYSNDIMGNCIFGNHPPPALNRQFLPQTGKMKVHIDLNKGIENYNPGSCSNKSRFHNLLQWILENQESLKTSSGENTQRLSLDFISDMCNLIRAMRTPYNVTEAWAMGAVDYKGTIYLRSCCPPKKNASFKVSTPMKDPRKPLQQKNDRFPLNEKKNTPTIPKKKLLHPVDDFFPEFERHSEKTVRAPTFRRNFLHSSNAGGYNSSFKTNSSELNWPSLNCPRSSSPRLNCPRSSSPRLNCPRSSSPRLNCSKESSLEDATMWIHIFRHIVRGGDLEDEVDGSIEYRCVLKTAFGPNTVLYSPSTDCVHPDDFTNNFEHLKAFLSVKCCPQINDKKRRESYRKYKLCQWWSENLLTGIPRTLVGFRDDEGIVNTLELLTTKNILEVVEGEWDPKVCLTFLQEFLEFVKAMLKKYPGKILSFEYEPRGDIRCKTLKGHDFLPPWFKGQLFPEQITYDY